MESEFIYHVTTQKEWDQALLKNEYLPLQYEKDGFIHCSFYIHQFFQPPSYG